MYGLGLLKGLVVTMRHFIESFTYDRTRNPLQQLSLKGRYDEAWLEKHQEIEGKGIFTIQYPEQKRQITEHFRFIPMLVYEEDPQEMRCTACGICARVCPPQCIWIERSTDDKGRPQAKPGGFWIDAVICMSCGYCTEYCPFDAIKMNQEFQLATTDRDRDMFYDLEKLLVPVEYYAKLHPSDYAAEEEARRAERRGQATGERSQRSCCGPKGRRSQQSPRGCRRRRNRRARRARRPEAHRGHRPQDRQGAPGWRGQNLCAIG